MGRYPAEALEDKLVWMRERQRKRQAAEARKIEPGRVVPLPPDPPLLPQMLRVGDVAKLLKVSPQTVKRWFLRRAVVVQGPQKITMLIPQRELDDWIREHTNSR